MRFDEKEFKWVAMEVINMIKGYLFYTVKTDKQIVSAIKRDLKTRSEQFNYYVSLYLNVKTVNEYRKMFGL